MIAAPAVILGHCNQPWSESMPFHTPPSAEVAGYAGFALFEALSDLLIIKDIFDAKRGRRTPRENGLAPPNVSR
jgi:hypothetical protein